MTVVNIIIGIYFALTFLGYSLYFFDDYPPNFQNFCMFLFVYVTLPIWFLYKVGLETVRFAKKLWKKCRKLLTKQK